MKNQTGKMKTQKRKNGKMMKKVDHFRPVRIEEDEDWEDGDFEDEDWEEASD